MFEELLERNRKHVEKIGDRHFEGLHESQRPGVVSVCCSDSRVSQEGMWNIEESGWLFTSSNIGNQAWVQDERGTDKKEKVVDGSILYPVVHTETRNILVVGHTGCGAVTAAYQWVTKDEVPEYDGIYRLIKMLVPVVEEGLESSSVDETCEDRMVINQLVEFSVHKQGEFLVESEEIPDYVDVYGFVYDFQGAYGDKEGVTYLVSRNGETEFEIPDGYEEYAKSLLD